MATFEMLWDCAYCGTKKLLGKTHRFCPGCGAPQDPAKRYFPTEAERVAVEDHAYVGADRTCGACGSAMSAKAVHCTQCGSSLEGAGEVRRVAEQPAASPAAPPVASRAGGGKLGCVLGGLLAAGALFVVLVLVAVFWRKDVSARVTGHSWQRSITIEKLGPQSGDEWCDALPGGAYGVSRRQEVREQRRVPDGEDCRTVRVDQGDGTYREERECTPRFREEPVYAQRCRFTVDRWQAARSLEAKGAALDPAPSWPQASLSRGECRGCEREGARRASYRVHFAPSEGAAFECEVDEAAWRSYEAGSLWQVRVGRLTGGAGCGGLKRQ